MKPGMQSLSLGAKRSARSLPRSNVLVWHTFLAGQDLLLNYYYCTLAHGEMSSDNSGPGHHSEISFERSLLICL